MLKNDKIVIVGASRTPIGAFGGNFRDISAPTLGSFAIKQAIENAGLEPHEIEDVIMGLVLMAGQGQAPARQAVFKAGIPKSTGATTLNKMCGSGMKATMLAHDNILAGSHKIMVAGGMENMTNAPYLLHKVRNGLRMGHSEIVDHMFFDGLEDIYEKGTLMGVFAERTAEAYQFTRETQDKFAIRSLERALDASGNGSFEDEIVPVKCGDTNDEMVVDVDEQPFKSSIKKISNLKPAFKKNGTITAANASSISDGAAALVLMKMSEAEKRGLQPIATICGHATFAHEPEWFSTAPIESIKKVLDKAGWKKKDVDLYEINEAFAVVTLAAMKELSIPEDQINIHGGACAMGHPIGASGARIIVTLLNALKRNKLKKGVASLCIGGGEATALAVEMVN